MPNLETTDRYIDTFRDLPDGWHFGEGHAPNKTAINLIRELLKFAADAGIKRFDAFPGVEGEIELAMYIRDLHLTVTYETDGRFTVSESDERGEYVDTYFQSRHQCEREITSFASKLKEAA